jgi:hypothetical protein
MDVPIGEEKRNGTASGALHALHHRNYDLFLGGLNYWVVTQGVELLQCKFVLKLLAHLHTAFPNFVKKVVLRRLLYL